MNAITHPFAPEEIMAFVDGELPADRAESVSAHIDQCSECREIRESLRSASAKMAAWSVETLQQINERDFPPDARTLPSREKWISSLSGVRDLLSRRWVWAPALSFVVALVALAALLPNLFVRHMSAPVSTAVMIRRSEPIELEPYTAPRAKISGGGGGGLDELESRPDATKTPVAGMSLSAPMIARTVSLSIVVKDFEAGRASLDSILVRHNGYTAGLNVTTPQGAARTLQASLRIPAPQLAAALSELKALGRVEVETQNGEEVTQQHADLVARLKNSRETEQRLQDVLRTRTGKVKDVLEVEREIERVRGEIEEMEAEQQTLEHRVSFASIDLKLSEEYKAQLTAPAPSVAMQLRNGLIDGFRGAFQSLLALVLFFAESGPTLLLWLMILAFPAWLLWRRYRRSLAMGSSFAG
jgi:hypothetical protein